jgi:hypothetical protein
MERLKRVSARMYEVVATWPYNLGADEARALSKKLDEIIFVSDPAWLWSEWEFRLFNMRRRGAMAEHLKKEERL